MQAEKQVSSGSDHVRIDPKRPKRKRKRGKGKSIKKTLLSRLDWTGWRNWKRTKRQPLKTDNHYTPYNARALSLRILRFTSGVKSVLARKILIASMSLDVSV